MPETSLPARIQELLSGFDAPFDSNLYLSEAGATPRATALAGVADQSARLQAAAPEGSRALILCDAPEAAVSAFYACVRAGLCAVPLHPATPDAAMAHIRSDSGAQLLISDRSAAALPAPLADLPQVAPSGTDTGGTDAGAAPAEASTDPGRLVALLYTSGTTGAPRSVMVSLGNLATMADVLSHDFFRLGTGDVILMAAPLSNIYDAAAIEKAERPINQCL